MIIKVLMRNIFYYYSIYVQESLDEFGNMFTFIMSRNRYIVIGVQSNLDDTFKRKTRQVLIN